MALSESIEYDKIEIVGSTAIIEAAYAEGVIGIAT